MLTDEQLNKIESICKRLPPNGYCSLNALLASGCSRDAAYLVPILFEELEAALAGKKEAEKLALKWSDLCASAFDE